MEAIKDVIGYNKRPLTSSSKVREEHLSLGKINRAALEDYKSLSQYSDRQGAWEGTRELHQYFITI